jgi:hypothetical protein
MSDTASCRGDGCMELGPEGARSLSELCERGTRTVDAGRAVPLFVLRDDGREIWGRAESGSSELGDTVCESDDRDHLDALLVRVFVAVGVVVMTGGVVRIEVV